MSQEIVCATSALIDVGVETTSGGAAWYVQPRSLGTSMGTSMVDPIADTNSVLCCGRRVGCG